MHFEQTNRISIHSLHITGNLGIRNLPYLTSHLLNTKKDWFPNRVKIILQDFSFRHRDWTSMLYHL